VIEVYVPWSPKEDQWAGSRCDRVDSVRGGRQPSARDTSRRDIVNRTRGSMVEHPGQSAAGHTVDMSSARTSHSPPTSAPLPYS